MKMLRSLDFSRSDVRTGEANGTISNEVLKAKTSNSCKNLLVHVLVHKGGACQTIC